MKNKMINAGICDAREVTEESLAGFDSVQVNAGILITSPRAKELMNRYPVRLNTAMVLEVPDGQEVSVKILNGKAAIGPGDDGTGIFLIVNGRLTVGDGSLEAVKSYYRILVNGRLLMPEGYRGRVPDLSVNGSTEYYPDGATLLKGDTEVDGLFVARAAGSLYYCTSASPAGRSSPRRASSRRWSPALMRKRRSSASRTAQSASAAAWT